MHTCAKQSAGVEPGTVTVTDERLYTLYYEKLNLIHFSTTLEFIKTYSENSKVILSRKLKKY